MEKLIEIVSPSPALQSFVPLAATVEAPVKVEKSSFRIPESPKKAPAEVSPPKANPQKSQSAIASQSKGAPEEKKYGLVLPSGQTIASSASVSKSDAKRSAEDEGDVDATKKRRYGVVTKEQAEQDYAVEDDDVEIAPDLAGKSKSQAARLNAAYGY